MSQVVIGDIIPYTQATAILNQTVFGTNWTANAASDVVVYVTPFGSDPDDATQILNYPADYSVDFIGSLQEVQVTLVNPSGAGDIVTIIRNTPADRENLYTNTNFTPSMLNNDFGILTLVDQQAQLVDQLVGPRYNYSAVIAPDFLNPTANTILPILGANQIWAKNLSNTAIIAVDLSEVISGGTVSEIIPGTGLTSSPNPITTVGTISFAAIAPNSLWANTTSSTAVPGVTPLSTFLLSANNLLDLPNKVTARANLGVAIGTNVEAWSPVLDSLAALSGATDAIPYYTSPTTLGLISAAASSVLITSAGNVPSLSQTLPLPVQSQITQLGAQTQALNMNSQLINNLATPVSNQDAATKAYVDSAGGAFLPLLGGTMQGAIVMGNFNITNMADPVNPQDAATKHYADVTFLKLDGTNPMAAALNMNTHKIINVSNPTVSTDAANKAYVDSTVGNYLPLLGGVMLGEIDMGNHKIINVTDPSLNQDAVNLEYLNTQLALYLPLSGSGPPMTGPINMNSHKITNLTDPTNPQDAATKNYVDSVAIGFTVKQAVQAATTGTNLNATYVNGASGIGATLTNAGSLAALVIDGYSVQTNDRLLIKDQTSTFQNGIYVATNVGSGAVAWILTRSTDFDQPSEIQPGDLVIVNLGTANAGTSWLETASVSAVGTSPILFSQFTFSATSVLLKANNLSDVANKTTAFNNISPLTTKADLITYDGSNNVRLGVGANSTLLQANSATATGLQYTSATYPTITTANQLLWSSATNTISGLSTLAGGVLVTDSSNVPQWLTNPTAAGKILQSGNSAIPSWSVPTYPSASGTSGKFLISDGTNNVYSTSTIPTSAGATANKVLLSDGTNYILSTPTFPNASATAGKIIRSDGTNWLASSSTFPDSININSLLYASAANVISALPPANNGLLVTGPTTGTPSILAGPGTTGNMLLSNAAAAPSFSTSTIPSSAGATANKWLISDGTNYVLSVNTFPNASATARKIIVSDGTNWVASTETYAVPSTSGNILTSDGTNWISQAPVSTTLLTTKGDLFSFSTVPARFPAATGDGKILQILASATTGLAYSTPTYPSASGTARTILVSNGTNIIYSTETYAVPGASGNVMTSDGTNWTSTTPAATSQNPIIASGRLTLTSGLPVTTADVTAATSVYFTPYKGNQISLYDGVSTWTTLTFAEITISVPASTSQMYDLFAFNNSGSVAFDSPLAWTNDTTRATALVLQNGVYVKSGATTRRYIGSFRTTAVSGQTEDSLAKRYVWNYNNRVLRPMKVTASGNWNYSTAAYRQANATATNQLDCVIGWSEDEVNCHVINTANSSILATVVGVGIGINSTTVNSASTYGGGQVPPSVGAATTAWADFVGFLAVGRNTLVWLEYGYGSGTQTWYATSVTVFQGGITGNLLG